MFVLSVPLCAFAEEAVGVYNVNLNNTVSSDKTSTFGILKRLDAPTTDKTDNFAIKVEKLTQNSAELSWGSDTVCLGYTVYKYNSMSNNWDFLLGTPEQNCIITGLTADTEYRICIKNANTEDILAVTKFKTEKAKTNPEDFSVKLEEMGLPAVSGKTKTFAYYTAVTVKSSPQYKLLNSDECYTDPETGIRMVDGCYCVALGSFYGSKIGTKYRITVSSGNSFDVILCDQKADRHTDKNHQYARRNKDILEFYVEKHKIPKKVRGSYDVLEQFSGSIVSIEKYI